MQRKNNYFYASGILTIIAACIEVLGAILLISIFFSLKSNIIENLSDPNRIEFIQGAVITTTVVSLVMGILTTVAGCFFFSFSKYTKEQVENRTAFIVIMIILQIIFGGLIACALSVAGIIVGREDEMAKIKYENLEENKVENNLRKIKDLYEENLIDEDEYKKLKNEILNKKQD